MIGEVQCYIVNKDIQTLNKLKYMYTDNISCLSVDYAFILN